MSKVTSYSTDNILRRIGLKLYYLGILRNLAHGISVIICLIVKDDSCGVSR
jgi:hypothetical protein